MAISLVQLPWYNIKNSHCSNFGEGLYGLAMVMAICSVLMRWYNINNSCYSDLYGLAVFMAICSVLLLWYVKKTHFCDFREGLYGLAVFMAIVLYCCHDINKSCFSDFREGLYGSAVCGFTKEDIQSVFEGDFKDQEDSTSLWLPVPTANIPTQRPGLVSLLLFLYHTNWKLCKHHLK